MPKELNKRLFSFIFLSIFFIKMAITVAPLIAVTLDARSVYAVVMQLEIECGAGCDKSKAIEKEYFHNFLTFSLPGSHQLLTCKVIAPEDDDHFRAFYPSVPTPPPNV